MAFKTGLPVCFLLTWILFDDILMDGLVLRVKMIELVRIFDAKLPLVSRSSHKRVLDPLFSFMM